MKCATPIVAALAISPLVLACSTSLVVTRPDGDAKSRIGIPHPMSMSQYDFVVNYQVRECGDPIKLKVTAEVPPPKTVPDVDNFFVLDPSSLSNALKTGAVDVTYHPNGSVATLNGKAEDRSAQVIAGLGSLAVSLASFRAMPQIDVRPEAQPAPARPTSDCTPEVVKALEALESQTGQVQATAQALDKAVDQLKQITDKAAAMGPNVDDATKKALSAALDSVTANLKKNDDAKKALTKSLESISHQTTFSWPAKADDTSREVMLHDAVLAQWLTRKVNDGDRAQSKLHFTLASLAAVPQRVRQIELGYGFPSACRLRQRCRSAASNPAPTSRASCLARRVSTKSSRWAS